MTDKRALPPRSEIIAALRSRSEAGWDVIGDTIRDQVRAAQRPGRLLRITGPSTRPPGDITVREQAFRGLLARAIRVEVAVDTPDIELDIDDQQLTSVRVTLRDGLDPERRVVTSRVRHVIARVVRDVLGEAQHNLLTQRIDVDLTRSGAVNEE